MANNKIWYVRYVVGNPVMFSKIRTSAASPQDRKSAIADAQHIGAGRWRVWVENAAGQRIFESAIEKQWEAGEISQNPSIAR